MHGRAHLTPKRRSKRLAACSWAGREARGPALCREPIRCGCAVGWNDAARFRRVAEADRACGTVLVERARLRAGLSDACSLDAEQVTHGAGDSSAKVLAGPSGGLDFCHPAGAAVASSRLGTGHLDAETRPTQIASQPIRSFRRRATIRVARAGRADRLCRALLAVEDEMVHACRGKAVRVPRVRRNAVSALARMRLQAADRPRPRPRVR